MKIMQVLFSCNDFRLRYGGNLYKAAQKLILYIDDDYKQHEIILSNYLHPMYNLNFCMWYILIVLQYVPEWRFYPVIFAIASYQHPP